MAEAGSAIASAHTSAAKLETLLAGPNCHTDWANVSSGIGEVELAACVMVAGHTALRNGGNVAGRARATPAGARGGTSLATTVAL